MKNKTRCLVIKSIDNEITYLYVDTETHQATWVENPKEATPVHRITAFIVTKILNAVNQHANRLYFYERIHNIPIHDQTIEKPQSYSGKIIEVCY